MAAGGDAGSFVGKGQNAFQFVHSQGVQLLLAELRQGSSKEGISRAVGVAHLARNASHMTGLIPKAVEYAICPQGDKDQPDAVLGKLGCALGTVGGAGKQGQLLSAAHQQRLIRLQLHIRQPDGSALRGVKLAAQRIQTGP